MQAWHVENLYVILGLSYREGGRAATHNDPISLVEFLRAVPPEAGRAAGAPAAGGGHSDPSGLARWIYDNPWALGWLEEGKQMEKRRRKHSPGEIGVPEENSDNDGDSDDGVAELEAVEAVAEVWADMAEAREALASLDVSELFKVRPLGGNWTAQHVGIGIDAYQGVQCFHFSDPL